MTGDTDWRPAWKPKMVDEDFAELERRYLAGLVHSNPDMAKELSELIARHDPPKLERKDVAELPDRLFRSGVGAPDVNIVRRMIKELGLNDG